MGDKISEKNQGLLNQISKEKKIPIYKMFVDYSSREYKLDYKEVLKNY